MEHSPIHAGKPFMVKFKAPKTPGSYWITYRLKAQHEFGDKVHLNLTVKEKYVPKPAPAEVKGSSLLDVDAIEIVKTEKPAEVAPVEVDKKMEKSALLVSKLEIDEPDSANLEKSFEVNNDEPEDKEEAEPIIEDLPR